MGKKGQGATKHDPMQSGDGLLPADAITADHFNELMTACLPDGAGGDVAVAVSGGADSMALCLLAQGWAKAQGVRLFALTVDHGLRADAAAEARQVGQWLSGHDIEHHVLGHEDPPPRANIQAWARELGLVNFVVDEATAAELAGVENSGEILADGGRVILTARVASDLKGAAVNSTGLVRASSLQERDGEIFLTASGGDIVHSGTVDVSGKGGAGGDDDGAGEQKEVRGVRHGCCGCWL